MPYVPALDGLRALAVFAVLAFHSGAPWAGGGYIGVDLFFVLSGYLITTLLRDEQERAGRINVGRFYARRAIRLYPTLLLMLVGFVIAAPYVWPDLPAWRYAAWVALYLSDYSRALLGEPIVLSYTWSLSVEEHFYLLWPLLLPWVLQRRNPLFVLAIAYVVATAWRWTNYYWLGWDPTYFRFDTRLSGLILGCLLVWWRPHVDRLVPVALLAMAALVVLPTFQRPAGLIAVLPVAEAASAILVLACVGGSAQVAWAGCGLLSYLGRLSYGIYIFHFPVIYWLRDQFDWATTLAAAAAWSVAAAAVTYHLIDLPLRTLRQRHSGLASTQPVTPQL